VTVKGYEQQVGPSWEWMKNWRWTLTCNSRLSAISLMSCQVGSTYAGRSFLNSACKWPQRLICRPWVDLKINDLLKKWPQSSSDSAVFACLPHHWVSCGLVIEACAKLRDLQCTGALCTWALWISTSALQKLLADVKSALQWKVLEALNLGIPRSQCPF